MIKPKVSIIVPIYDVEKYLERCINSIVNQTYTNLEILLVDDGSPDNCPNICDQWGEKDSRIKVIHKKNGGLSDARNFGLNESTGKYIGFVDSDDWINVDMIEYLVELLQKNNSDLSICGYNVVYNDEEKSNQEEIFREYNLEKEIFMRLILKNEIESFAWNKLYKRELFDNIEFPVGRKMEDIATLYKIFDKCTKITISDKKEYNYFQREDSILHSKQRSFYIDYFDAVFERYNYFEKNHIELHRLNCDVYSSYFFVFVLLKIKFDDLEKKWEIIDYYNLNIKYKIKYILFKLFPSIYIFVVRRMFICLKKLSPEDFI